MDTFEFNKIAASVLVALLVAMTGSLLSDILIHPQKLDKSVLTIAVPTPGAAAGEKKEEALKPIAPLLASASVERGQAVAKQCTQCHTFEKGGPAHTGPNLWGIIGAKFAHFAGFAYSTAMKSKEGTWNYEELNQFINNPRKFVPGTKMSFVGIQDAQKRADVIAYLNTLSDSPKALPK